MNTSSNNSASQLASHHYFSHPTIFTRPQRTFIDLKDLSTNKAPATVTVTTTTTTTVTPTPSPHTNCSLPSTSIHVSTPFSTALPRLPTDQDPTSSESITAIMLKRIDHFSEVLDDLEAKREKRAENQEGLKELQRRVSGPSINFTRPGRRLLKQGKVTVVDSVRTKPKERLLVLTNDLLLVLREKKRSIINRRNLSIVQVIPMQNAELNDISIVGQDHSFMVYSQTNVGIFSTSSKYEKFEWLRLVKDCIDSYDRQGSSGGGDAKETGDDDEELVCFYDSGSSSSQPVTPRGDDTEKDCTPTFDAPVNSAEVTVSSG